MRNEPGIDRTELIDHVNRLYAVRLTGIDFLPVGEGAWCYRGVGSADLFIRMTKMPSAPCVFSLHQYLYDIGFPTTALLATTCGEYSSSFAGSDLSVQEFFAGPSLMSKVDMDRSLIRREIGCRVRALHRITTDIAIPIEKFDRFQAEARSLLASPLDAVLVELLESKQSDINLLIDAAMTSGRQIRQTRNDLVVCHGDLHEDNVLLDDKKHFVIIDWDNAVRAPRERDLMHFMGTGWADYLEGYTNDGQIDVNRETINYYILEWALQEIVDYATRISSDDRFDGAGRSDAREQFQRLFHKGGDVDRALKLIEDL